MALSEGSESQGDLPHTDTPFAMVDDDPNDAIISSRPGSRARAAGLTTRTAAETADATRRWDDKRGQPLLTKGPTREQEATLVRALRT